MHIADFADLYAEHAVLVASLAGTAHALAVMPRVCTHWRNALTSERETLWRSVTLCRFPVLRSVLSTQSSTLSFSELYRRQIVSEKLLHSTPSHSLGIECYIFTITVEVQGAVVLQWSGKLVATNDDSRYWCTPSLWTETTIPVCGRLTDENDTVVSVDVTHDMHTVRLLHSSGIAIADTSKHYIQYDFDCVPAWPFADTSDKLYRPDINLCLWCNEGKFCIWIDDMGANPLGAGDFPAYLSHIFKPIAKSW